MIYWAGTHKLQSLIAAQWAQWAERALKICSMSVQNYCLEQKLNVKERKIYLMLFSRPLLLSVGYINSRLCNLNRNLSATERDIYIHRNDFSLYKEIHVSTRLNEFPGIYSQNVFLLSFYQSNIVSYDLPGRMTLHFDDLKTGRGGRMRRESICKGRKTITFIIRHNVTISNCLRYKSVYINVQSSDWKEIHCVEI